MSGYNDVIDAIQAALANDDHASVTTLLESLRPKAERVFAVSIFGAKTRQPFVEIRIGDTTVVQWSPADARGHALQVLEAAEGAEQDAFLITWLMERVGGSLMTATALLQEYRAFRAGQREQAS